MGAAEIVTYLDSKTFADPKTETANDQSQHIRWILVCDFEGRVKDSRHLFRCKSLGILILWIHNRQIDVLVVPASPVDLLTVNFQRADYKLSCVHDVGDGFWAKLFFVELLDHTFEYIVVHSRER